MVCTKMPLAALFILKTIQKPLKFPQRGEELSKLRVAHTLGYFLSH